jgi:Ca2+-binding RTX toxin-like protein
MFTEALETRRMFAVTASLASYGTLWINGDAANNDISVARHGATVNVYDHGAAVGAFPATSVAFVYAAGGDGDDRIVMDHTVTFGVNVPTTINGGNGDDFMMGGRADDWYYGGPGSDTASFWARGEALDLSLDGVANDGAASFAGADVDNICNDVENVEGGARDDVITGNDGNNVLSGGIGNDRIYALGGNDTVWGSNGNDYVEAGDGHDQIYGEDGNDSVDAGAGNDWLLGGNGDDNLRGGFGSDVVSGGAGNDFVSGHGYYNPASPPYFNDDTDHLIGGTGRDTLIGFGGRDYYTGDDDGGETDTLYVNFGSRGVLDVVRAGPGDIIV